MRLVSLLPSTTEILHALGAGPEVVGVTFECDHPPQARESAAIVSTSAMPEGLTPTQIDDFVVQAMRRGEDLYHLDEGALAGLDADLVLTQDLCAVCAVDVSVVDEALAHLGCEAQVLTVDPHTLEEVIASISTIGAAVGRTAEAAELVAGLEHRLAALEPSPGGRRVMLLEWTDPPYAPGHWVPQMIERAGGVPVLGSAGEKSVRVTWEAINAAQPEVVIAAPCGYDLDGSIELGRAVLDRLPHDCEVWAVDANASFARPGPRLVDGIEALAALLRADDPDDRNAPTDPPHPLSHRLR